MFDLIGATKDVWYAPRSINDIEIFIGEDLDNLGKRNMALIV